MEPLPKDDNKGNEGRYQDEYLRRSEFYHYMGKFRTGLENRLTLLEARLSGDDNGSGSGSGSGSQRKSFMIERFKEGLIYVLLGAVLSLAGAAAAVTLF